MSKKIVITLMAVICFVNIATALEPPIYIGCGNSTDIVDGDKVWLAGDDFATTPLSDWNFGTNYEYMSPEPAPAEVYADTYHKNSWCDLTEYDEISVPVANGTYLVRLHMFSNNTTHRKMDITIEGVLVLDDYDPQAEALLLGASSGANAIVIPEVIVEVTDGDGMQIRDSAGDMGGGCSDTWIGAVEILSHRDPVLASDPTPENEIADVPYDVILTWTPGAYAPAVNGHIVYFSDSFDDVNDGIGGVTQDANSYDPGRLELEQTYYWRVDEVNAVDATVYEGEVWSFTVEPFARPIPAQAISATASTSLPGQGPEKTVDRSGLDVNDLHSDTSADMWLSEVSEPNTAWIQYEFDVPYKLHQMLVWNYNGQGFNRMTGFKEVIVKYSLDGTNWTPIDSVSEFEIAPGTPAYAANTTVDFNGVPVRYIHIGAKSNWSNGFIDQYGLSEVQFLYIPLSARIPVPDDGATEVAIDVSLNWKTGREAAEHKVYLSADSQSVENSTAPAETVLETSYGPLSLDLGQTYYWRVDEVNNANTVPIWEGSTWSFTTSEYLVVDDFESYNDIEAGEEGSNLIYATWIDGYVAPPDVRTNGSTVGYIEAFQPTMETDIVHSGKQSVPVSYDNTIASLSEVTVSSNDLAVGSDWTVGAPAVLTLWFYGDPNNAATEQMYVKVNSSNKVIYGGDLTQTDWQEFSVDLASLGIDLSNVSSLTIGFERIGATGGSGKVFIDDIWLYSPAAAQ